MILGAPPPCPQPKASSPEDLQEIRLQVKYLKPKTSRVPFGVPYRKGIIILTTTHVLQPLLELGIGNPCGPNRQSILLEERPMPGWQLAVANFQNEWRPISAGLSGLWSFGFWDLLLKV